MNHSFSTPSPKTYGSPDFQPFNYNTHSPDKLAYTNRRNPRNSRYFNNYGTPQNHKFRRGNFHNRGRRSDTGIDCYLHWSMMEDPWKSLEKSLQKDEKTVESNASKVETTHDNSDCVTPDRPD